MEAAADATPPAWLAGIAEAVDHRLLALLGAERERWSVLDADLRLPFDALVEYTLRGGKRLRAAFCHWGFVGHGGDPEDPHWVEAASALELLQAFALLHDDVMDGSTTRRGAPALHVSFSGRHGDQGWRGEARRFGEGAAILIGDLAFVYAGALLRGMPAPALAVWDELRLEVNVGQYLDLLNSARGNPTVESASRICTYKSGKYTIERPLHLGATAAGAVPGPVLDALSAYGLPLGEAFQLVDDLLGAFGEAERTGKPVGDDFREGKPTRLVALGLERTAGADRALLAERVGAPDLSADEVVAIQGVLEASGAKAAVEEAAAAMAEQAVRAAEDAPLTDDARTALADLARFVIARDH